MSVMVLAVTRTRRRAAVSGAGQACDCAWDCAATVADTTAQATATLKDRKGLKVLALPVKANYGPGEALPVVMHDGSRIVLRKCEDGYDPTDRSGAQVYIQERMKEGEYLTGLLFVEPSQNEFHTLNRTPDAPLNSIPYEKLSPGAAGLDKILARYR